MIAQSKTRVSDPRVARFLQGIKDEARRADCESILEIMGQVTGAKPKMWGGGIVGFGDYHYKYASGREGDTFLVGFSPRKENVTLYFMSYLENYADLLKKLGRHKTGKGCLYIKTLDDVHLPTLRKLIQQSVRGVSRAEA